MRSGNTAWRRESAGAGRPLEGALKEGIPLGGAVARVERPPEGGPKEQEYHLVC
jgi:hypothetical protein